jgi:WD40 repeat protein
MQSTSVFGRAAKMPKACELFMSNNSDQIIVKHKDSMIENLRRFLFGDDIFISYSHVDSTYALRLANELTKKKLSCFLDQWGTPPGQELPKELINTLKRCSTMVLVGSKYAAESKNVGIEVEKFLETHRPIIPVTFVEDDLMADTTEDSDTQNLTGTLEQAKWYFTISGIAKTIENLKALKTGTPSENIISRIVNATEFRSRSKRLRRAFFATLGTIGLIVLLGVIVVYNANNRVKAAQKYADEAIRKANEATLLAEEKTAEADRATLRANFQETRASEQEKKANEKAEELNKATKETQKQIAIAREQTKIAGAARKREGEAKLSEKTAIRENFIERARQDLNNNYPFRAAVYLNEAYGMFPANEDPRKMSSFRFLLGLSMKSVESLLFKTRYQEDVLSIRFSPDGKYIVTADADDTKNTENTARILDAKTGKDASPPILHGFDVNTAEFSLDSKRIVTSSDDHTSRFWDLEARKGFIFKHPSDVKSAKFSPDGKRIATIDRHCIAKVWTIRSYKEKDWTIVPDKEDLSLDTQEIISPKEDQKSVKLAAFSPDLKQIVIVDYDGGVTLYDIEKNQKSAPFEHEKDGISQSSREGGGRVRPAEINTAVFSPNGKYIVTASDDKTAKVLDLDNKKVATFQHQSEVLSSEFSRDSKRIVTVSANNTVSVWDIKTEAFVTSVQHDNTINLARFSPDGTMIVTASNDKTAKVWDAKTGILLASLEHESFVFLAEFSPDSRQIVTASRGHISLYEHEKIDPDNHDHVVKLWNLTARADISTVTHQKNVVSARFSPNNDRIVTASWDGTAIIQDVNTGKGSPINPEKCPEGSGDDLPSECLVRSAEFSHDGEQVVIASGNRATVWEAKTGNLIHSLRHSGLVSSAKFSPDDKHVVTASYDGTAKIWDLSNTQNPIATIEHHGNVNSAKFSPDGKRIATAGDDNKVNVYDMEKKQVIATLQHKELVFSAEFSPDSRQIVTASRDKTAKVLDIGANKVIATARHTELILSAEFSPDGKTIVTAGYDNTANIWDIKTGILTVSMPHQNRVRSAKFSPDGRMIVTASDDKTAKVWDVETGKLLVSVKHQDQVRSAEFSSDGTQIVTASFDDTAKVWRFSPETRPLEVIEEIVRSKVPFRLENRALVPRENF